MKPLAVMCWVVAAWTLAMMFHFGEPFLIVGLTVGGFALWWHDSRPKPEEPFLPPKPRPRVTHQKFNADEGEEEL